MEKYMYCPTCSSVMASDAPACPKCGKENKAVRRSRRGNVQGGGCLLTIIGIVIGFLIHPVLGGAMIVVGIAIVVVGLFV